MTQFLMKNTLIPPYMAFPRFLLDMEQLSETAKILYVLLLDRARLSQKNDGWTDALGRAFIFFPIKDLAETMHKSEMSVKTALAVLEKADLIYRKRQGPGFPNKIYVKVSLEYLEQTDRNLSLIQTENYPPDRQETVSVRERKLSGSNKKNNIKKEKQRSKADRTAYGKYQNVFLCADELEQLLKDVPLCQEYIEKLSGYMQTSGKRYKDHAATIRSWYIQDHPAPVKRSYECKEDESL
jgi:hypothetical protein